MIFSFETSKPSFNHLAMTPTIPEIIKVVFQFGVSPEKQGNGTGSKIIKPVLKWIESQNVACYLETHKQINIEFIAI